MAGYLRDLCRWVGKNNPMPELSNYSLPELKLVYQILHGQISTAPALMDTQILEDLQRYLQQQASTDGVDVSLHAEWSAWLNA